LVEWLPKPVFGHRSGDLGLRKYSIIWWLLGKQSYIVVDEPEHPMTKPLLNFRVDPEVAELVKALAAEDRRPVSQFLAVLVEDAIAQRKPAERRSAA
jgi:hypothetical protein